MDLIYMTSGLQDIGVLQDYELDLAYGEDENSFECKIDSISHCCQAGYFLYIEGTEYGGIIDSIKTDTGAEQITYSGRTWHGILGSKVIVPLLSSDASSGGVTVKTSDSGGSSLVGKYLVISGDANRCLAWMLSRLGLSTLFQAASSASGVNISNYQFDRYTDGYKGIKKMLSSAGLKLKISFASGHVLLSAVAKRSPGADEEFNSDQTDFTLDKKYKTCNHLICLGSGDLDQRTVVHLYADGSGNISQNQTYTGLDEVTDILDYPSAESTDELIKSGTERLKELMDATEITVDCDEFGDEYDVGDTVSAFDQVTGIGVSSSVTKKIVTVTNGKTIIQYKVGE